MTSTYVDATTLIALGTVGELDLLAEFSGTPVVVPTVRAEVTTQPARANLDRFTDRDDVERVTVADDPSMQTHLGRARSVLDEPTANGDVVLVAAVLAHTDADEPVGVVSDDRRVRTVAEGLGATVTGTIGVLVRAVEAGVPASEAKTILGRVDSHGLHPTAELRSTAVELIERAAE